MATETGVGPSSTIWLDAMAEISTDCAPLFYLLVHAALFPKLGLQAPRFVSTLEEDESHDSLVNHGLVWDHLFYVWAFETGAARLEEFVGGSDATVDAQGFYAALAELQGIVDVEFSIPLHPMGREGPLAWAKPPVEELPVFEGQRLHLCKRSAWFEIDFNGDRDCLEGMEAEDLESHTPLGEIPIFAEPVHSSDDSGRLGQVWVRIGESSRTQLQLALPDTLESLSILGYARAGLLQEALHREQPALNKEQMESLNGYVQMLRQHASVLHDTARRLLEIEDNDERERVSATFIELINSEHSGPIANQEPISRPTVFFSYSHDSDAHRAWVLTLSTKLSEHGVRALVDAAEDSPDGGWPRWMQRQVETANFVLCICTPLYKERFEGRQTLGTGRGADWEGLLITQLLYECGSRNKRLIPVLPESGSVDDIPLPLRPFTHYRLPSGTEQLLRRIKQPPDIGEHSVP